MTACLCVRDLYLLIHSVKMLKPEYCAPIHLIIIGKVGMEQDLSRSEGAGQRRDQEMGTERPQRKREQWSEEVPESGRRDAPLRPENA